MYKHGKYLIGESFQNVYKFADIVDNFNYRIKIK